MDYVSLVNLWCQKNGKTMPSYEYESSPMGWTCFTSWSPDPSLGTRIESVQQNKKAAKQDVAILLFNSYCKEVVHSLVVNKPTVLLVDGDQRSDVIKWLSKTEIPNNLEVHIYVSPCMNLTVDNLDKFVLHVAKTTSRDSADAMMLIDLGRLLYLASHEIIIVSSDHILVQAANDFSLRWAKNLFDLQQLAFSAER